MTGHEVGCVVVAFHRPKALGTLLASLDDPAIQVVVVNVEADPEVAAVAARRSGAVVIDMPNRGYAAGVNKGALSLSADVVVFMNDDAVLDVTTALSLGRRALEQNHVVVPAVRDHSGRLERTLQPYPSIHSLLLEWALLPDRPPRGWTGRSVRKWNSPVVAVAIEAAAAVAVACPMSVLREIPLPEEYFLYWEDSEWFWHLHQSGIRAEFAPDLVVNHAQGRADVRPEKSVLMSRNAVRCIRRTRGQMSAALALPVVVLWNLRLVIGDAVRAPVSRASRGHLPARLAGLRAALAAWREVR